MIRIHCDAAHAVLKETEILTAGMLNYPTVQLTYTDELAPYGKAAIVRAGTVERAVAITEDSFLVPSECLASSGVNLIIGIRFVGSSSVIPTMWCDCGMIYDGADPDQGSTGEATQDLVDQMIAYAEQIAESAEAYDQSIIRQVIANANNANQYGTANVTVADTGSGSNRTLTFYFSNLKGNGIESVSWVTSGEYKGRLQIREVNGTVTNFDAFIQPLANIEAMDSTAEESAEAAATSESNAEAWAVGERGGTPVDSADETYHNNSKYYADQASDYADAALDAANRAIAATGLEIDTVLDPTSVNPVRNMAIAEAINNLNDGKVDKAAGKQLSTEDYTTTEKNKLAGIASGAQVNTITGVKGDAESSYRTGDVNLTPANIGAVPATRTVNGKALSSNISLGASDVGAVPTTRTVNGKALSSNISLNSTDIIDDSDVGGSTVKASLNALKGSINTLQSDVTNLDNNKIDADAAELNDLSLLGYKSLFFTTTQVVPIGSTGVSIPAYSRCAFINYYSNDGALFAITTSGTVITAFRNSGTWVNAQQNATITDVQNAQNYSYEYVTLSNKSGNAVAYKVGHIVFFTSANDFNTLSRGFETIGQLPNGYFPLVPVRTNIVNYPATELFFVEIDTGGSIKVYSANGSQSARNGSFWAMWITA